MRIGVPKEIKPQERRVGLIPQAVAELTARGHEMFVQSGAGIGIGADDDSYRSAGADIVDTPKQVFKRADLIVKVKEPQPSEVALLDERHVLFTYLHLAADGGPRVLPIQGTQPSRMKRSSIALADCRCWRP